MRENCKRMRFRVLVLAGAVVVPLVASCASVPTDPAIDAPRVAARPAGPVELQELRVSDLEGGALLELEADGSLVWAQYRDDDGNLVVELPNTRVAAGVDTTPRANGLLRDVRVESQENGGRPLTRLHVATSTPVDHALVDDGGVLRLEFFADDAPRVARTELAEPIRPAAAPIAAPAPRVVGANEPSAASFAEPTSVESVATAGTPEAPIESVPSTGFIADRLEGVEVVDADSPALRIVGNGEFEYSSFFLENPDRYVLDLKGVVNRSSSSSVEVASGAVERVRLAQFRSQPDPVSRVVVDLRAAKVPTIERGPEGLLLTFGDALGGDSAGFAEQEPTTVAAAAAPPPAPIPITPTTPSEDDYEASEPQEDASGIVEADLSPTDGETPMESAPGPFEPIAAEEIEGDRLAAEAPAEPEPIGLAAVPDGAGAESGGELGWQADAALETTSETARPRIVLRDDPVQEPLRIEMVGGEERPSLPEPSDVSLFEAQDVRIEPNAQPEAEMEEPAFGVRNLSAEREYFGEPVTLSLKDADITEVLRSFAREFDLNIVIQPGVGGPVTVELNEVPWDQALDSILKVNGLGMDLEGSILRIAPVQRLQQEAENEQRLAQARALAVPLTTIMKRVSYATAQEIATILTTGLQSGGFGGGRVQQGVLSQRGSVSVDQRTNTLIIRELPEYLDTVIQIIENLDTPTEQVMIEARIIETTRNFSRALGIDWGFNGIASAATGNTTGLQFPNNVSTEGGVQLLTGGANGFLNIGLGNVLNTFQLDVTLQAAEADGLINVISAPKISTLDNVAASIQTGLQIPIQTVANNTVSVQFVNATLRLNVVPQVTAEGTIQMDIQIQKREPQLAFAVAGATNAPIATREAQTRVIVRDGGTAVIGGIYTVSTNQNVDKVPGLANIPILGHLFKNRNRSNQNEELLIFITPRVIQL